MSPSGPAQRADGGLAVFSTHDVVAAERADYWNEVTTRYFGPLETRATGRATLAATLATRSVSFLRAFHIVGTSHQVRRNKSNAGAIPDAVKLLLQVRGRCSIQQEGRTADLKPGSWCVYDSWRPYDITNCGSVEQVVIQIPRDQIIDRAFRQLAEPFVADPRSSMTQVAASFIRAYAASALEPDEGDEFLAETTVGFVRRALFAAQSQRRCAQAPSSQLRARVRQYILTHLNNPDLSIGRIAQAMGCSKRYLHQVFAAEDTTIERTIWRLRIEHCCQALAEEANLDKSISAIAFEWGFNSSAHFSRLFKAQVGEAPTAFRRKLAAASLAANSMDSRLA